MSRVCLITGGTQGIGQETAELLASEGWKVVISGRNSNNGEKIVNKIQAVGGEAIFIQADVTSQASVKNLHELAIAAFGKLDGAVNAAAISTDSAKVGEASAKKFQDMFVTNVLGLFWCMQEQIRVMLPNKSGHIVNLASIAGLHGVLYSGTYCATKHAVRGCSDPDRSPRICSRRSNITAVAPRAIKTTILNDAINTGMYTEECIAAMHPVKRMGEPMDIARAISFLLNSPFVTGSVLEVDGGVGAS